MQIKFKAWDKTLKEWNTSFLIDSEGLVYKNARDLEDGTSTFELDILRNTGLKDKNGVDIYEGYLVRDKFGSNHAVEFGEYYSDGYYRHCGWKTDKEFFEGLDNEYEVIGDIYQNPELLN